MTTQEADQHLEAPVALTTDEASTNFYWTCGNHEVFNLQTTIRSSLTDAQIQAHLDTVKRTLLAVVRMEGHAKSSTVGGTGKPAPGSEGSATTTTGKKPAPTVPGDKPVQSFVAKMLEVTPKPDGKAEIKFYAEGHKFPDLYATRTVEQWVNMLGGAWAPDDFATAILYEQANITVLWTESDKLNSKGKPYHDLVSLKAA